MFSVLLAVGLLTGILCGPIPNSLTELLPNERFAAAEPSSGPSTNTAQEINQTMESGSGSVNEEKLQPQETFYPVGGVWWGIRPWGGWGGWGRYRPWYRPPWGGHWGGGQWGGHWGGGQWGGHWGGGQWGRTSS